MKAFGLTLPEGSKIETAPLDNSKRGTAFPANPKHLDIFEIIEGGATPVGIYAYNERTTQWVRKETVSYPYDVGMSIAGKPEANKTVAMVVLVRPTIIPKSFGGSKAACDVAATAAAAFVVKLNGNQIGTINFAAGQLVGTFTGPAADLLCVAGDKLTISSPATADATLSYVAATLMGQQLSA
jgi:hypothetical protein